MADTQYLTFGDCIDLHQAQIKRYGGSSGIRDAGLIEAALQRPQSGYYRDIIEEAAAMWESLTMNHAFIDGNKRIGLACTYVFLGLNGIRITAEQSELETFILKNLEAGTFTKDNVDAWLRENAKPA